MGVHRLQDDQVSFPEGRACSGLTIRSGSLRLHLEEVVMEAERYQVDDLPPDPE